MTSNIYHFNIEHITSNLSIEEAAVTKFNCTHIKDTKSKYERVCVREREREREREMKRVSHWSFFSSFTLSAGRSREMSCIKQNCTLYTLYTLHAVHTVHTVNVYTLCTHTCVNQKGKVLLIQLALHHTLSRLLSYTSRTLYNTLYTLYMYCTPHSPCRTRTPRTSTVWSRLRLKDLKMK